MSRMQPALKPGMKATFMVRDLNQDIPAVITFVAESADLASRMVSVTGRIDVHVKGIRPIVAYMILASQFNSLLHPVTVLTILPLSIAGAAFALYFTGKSLNIFSMIGLLLLMGIVKKNSIILVDYANQIREENGADAAKAMLLAGPVRLRPILMTSISTLMAAIPPALALGPGAEIRSPMALSIIGGLTVSTVLSLLVVPAFYVTADNIVMWIKTRFKR